MNFEKQKKLISVEKIFGSPNFISLVLQVRVSPTFPGLVYLMYLQLAHLLSLDVSITTILKLVLSLKVVT